MSGLSDVSLNLIESLDDVLRFKEWLGQRRPHNALAADTETTGLKIGNDIVRLAQIGDGVAGWAMPWSNEVGLKGRYIGGWSGLFADVVRTWEGDWLLHNAPFDFGMLDHMGVRLDRSRIKDTRVLAHIHAPHLSTALKNVANRYIDGAASGAAEVLKATTWTWETVPIDYPPYWTYGALDPVLTYRIYEYLWPLVQADSPDAFELENAIQWVTQQMGHVRINTDFAQSKLIAFENYVAQLGEWVEATYGVKPGANASIIEVLQREGFTFSKATATGAVALDAEVLGGIDHPLAQSVLARRKIQKLASTYLRHFVNDVDADGYIHPTINTLGARTSRMSMSDPNFQNLPRHSEGDTPANTVRECVIPSEDHTLLMCDFDQVEMRMLADMAQEQPMIAAFKDTTTDFFVTLARLVFNDETIVKSDPRRQVTKNAGYATIFGAGVEKFAKTAGIPYAQAARVRQRWDELFPGVVRFQRKVVDVAVSRAITEGVPYVRCPITRRRHVADRGKEYALVNYMIQGAAAAVFKQKLLSLDAAGLGPYMMIPVHDEIILDVPNDLIPDVAATVRSIMNDNTLLSVPLSASVSIGSSWGNKKEYEWTAS